MKNICTGCVLLLTVAAAMAQAPVEDQASREQAIQRGQRMTSEAYRALEQAQFEAKFAEQDFLNAQEANRVARQRAEEAARRLDAAKKSLDAAKSKEARARKRYDDALNNVDKAWQKPPAK